MKVLSLTEPYATLIKMGIKTIETRSWKTNYRGELYIHASSTKIPKEYRNNLELMALVSKEELNYGNIIVKCRLTDCIKMDDEYINTIKEKDKNNFITGVYESGRYAWILEDIEVLSSPIKVKGHLGIWNLEEFMDQKKDKKSSTETKDIKVRHLDPLVGGVRINTLLPKNRYSKEFCDIYSQYGWDNFSLMMGKSILNYFDYSKKIIRTHLDLGCGPGVLCDYFYHHHIKTTGVDISPDMIKLAREKNNKINFVVVDIIDYQSKKKYDLITMTCDVVNHILDDKDLEKVFSNSYSMLNADGYLIFDIYHNLSKNIVIDRGKGIKIYFSVTDDYPFISTNLKIKEQNRDIYECDVVEKLYDITYIKRLLEKNHFKIVKMDDKIFDETQKFKDKLYIICKKEG